MLLVGSILPAGAGGTNYWKLNAAAPATVNIDSAAGVNGIFAELPSNDLFKIVLANLAGTDTFAAGSLDLVNQVFTMVNITDKAGAIQTVDNVAQVALSIDFDANIANPDVFIVAVDALNNYTNAQFRADFIAQRVTALGIDSIYTQLNSLYWSIRDGNNNIVFQVRKDGQIETNQTTASVAVRAKVAEMPIYDAAGVLVGYIDINT